MGTAVRRQHSDRTKRRATKHNAKHTALAPFKTLSSLCLSETTDETSDSDRDDNDGDRCRVPLTPSPPSPPPPTSSATCDALRPSVEGTSNKLLDVRGATLPVLLIDERMFRCVRARQHPSRVVVRASFKHTCPHSTTWQVDFRGHNPHLHPRTPTKRTQLKTSLFSRVSPLYINKYTTQCLGNSL